MRGEDIDHDSIDRERIDQGHVHPAQMSNCDTGIALWGGVECTVNRIGDRYFHQLDRNGHALRLDDLDRFASLGIRALRYPVLWERIAPDGLASADWSWTDQRLPELRSLGIEPIVGLVHHGSGPRQTHLLDPAFAPSLARYAEAVALRYPWVSMYTPVNEPVTTARFSALYGKWYPHAGDDRSFVKAVIHQCRATVLAMQAIRRVNPDAKLVQTDDLGKTWSTPPLAELASFYNERRWLGWDLLCGMVGPEHPLWTWLRETGIDVGSLDWFREHPCPPDVIGVNYYITSERWLDHRIVRYPPAYVGSYRGWHCADMETPRVFAHPSPGIAPLLLEAWQRYRRPLAITEAHIDARREDHLRWLVEIWQGAQQAHDAGADLRAVTIWALLGSYDWNSLCTQEAGHYEPGAFDVRSDPPRETAVAGLMRSWATHRSPAHPVLHGEGWWRRPGRWLAPPVTISDGVGETEASTRVGSASSPRPAPLLIVGATGTLGRAFARICEARHISCEALGRAQLDLADPHAVARAIDHYQPWAIVNAGGYVRVDAAETEPERCRRENVLAGVVLAVACARHGLPLLYFSSDLVFDGSKREPYVETDSVAPLGIYGRSKAEAEQRIAVIHPQALVVRTSAFFGPWDSVNFLSLALQALAEGRAFVAASDQIVSPTYVPDLGHAALDLLIDGERGIWHLSNGDPCSWADFAREAARMAGLPEEGIVLRATEALKSPARRPSYSALGSLRGRYLPPLQDALERYFAERRHHASQEG